MNKLFDTEMVRRVTSFLLIVIINVVIANISQDTWSILHKLLGKHPRSPIIVVLDTYSEHGNALRSSDYPHHTRLRSLGLDENIDDEKGRHWMKEVLRSTGNEEDPSVQETNDRFKSALRARCSKYMECKISCKEKTKPKKVPSCQKSCKDVYDYLTMCNPPGGKKKQKDSCGDSDETDRCLPPTRGKTLPPGWRT